MDQSRWTLMISGFVSSTILLGNSEIVLIAVLKSDGNASAAAITVVTVGNTLGGLTTYSIGRLLPSRMPEGKVARYALIAQAVALF